MMTPEEFFSKDDSEYEGLIDTEKYKQMAMEKEYAPKIKIKKA